MISVIVSDYSGSYESIYTIETRSIFLLKLKYQLKGYRVWAIPPFWLAKMWYKLFKKPIYKGTNVSFEKSIPGSDQIRWWSPYDNFR